MRLFVATSVLLLFAGCSGLAQQTQGQPAADAGLWRYVHPEAKVVAGVEWSRLMKSEVGRATMRTYGGSMSEFGGIDFAQHLESVLISSPGGGTGDPRFLVSLRGKFPVGKLREFVLRQGGLSRRHAGVELLQAGPAANEEVDLAVIDPGTILAGDRESLLDAVERRNEAQAELPVLARARQLSREHDLWVVVDSLDAFPRQGAAQSPLLADVQGVQGGLTVRTGLQLALRLQMASAKSANALAGAVKGFTSMAPGQDPAAQLLKQVAVTAERDAVNIRLALDQRQMQRTMASLAGSMLKGNRSLSDWVTPGRKPEAAPVAVAGVRPVAGSAAAAPVQAPREPERGVIRIVGLEEGTREIPYPQR